MDSIEFLFIIAVFAGILAWYLHNVRTGSDGHAGLFSLKSYPEAIRSEEPHAKNLADRKRSSQREAAPSGPTVGMRERHAFRQQEKPRFRIKDHLASKNREKNTAFP